MTRGTLCLGWGMLEIEHMARNNIRLCSSPDHNAGSQLGTSITKAHLLRGLTLLLCTHVHRSMPQQCHVAG